MKKVNINHRLLIVPSLLLFVGCACSVLDKDEYVVNDGKGISFQFDEGLNDDPDYRLAQDENGFYVYELAEEHQNIQRISVRLLDKGEVLYCPSSGYRHTVNWDSSLYWWLSEGDTVANITRKYFNPYTGEYQYVNLPPLVNWKDVLVPTINSSSVTDQKTGRGNSVIGPIGEMRGDTMTVYVSYNHTITKKRVGSSQFFNLGQKQIRDSVMIILE